LSRRSRGGQRRRRCRRALFLDAKTQRRGHDAARRRRFRRRLDLGGRRFGLNGFRLDDCRDRHLDGRRFYRNFHHCRSGFNHDGRRGFDDRRLVDRFGDLRHGLGSRRRGRLRSLDEARRRQRWTCRLDRLGRLFPWGCALLALGDWRFRKDVAAWQRDVALAGQPLDELPRDNLFDRARGALGVDAETLEKRGHFLAGSAE
jgi:hypothetical protein